MCAHVNRQLFEVLWASAPVHSPAFTLIVPAITSVPLSALEKEGQDNDVAICKAVLYGASEVHKGVYSGLPRLAPTFPLRDGFLAYLMQFVHISSLPTLLILGSSKADASEVHTQNCRGAMSSNVWSSQQRKMNFKFIACHHLFDNSIYFCNFRFLGLGESYDFERLMVWGGWGSLSFAVTFLLLNDICNNKRVAAQCISATLPQWYSRAWSSPEFQLQGLGPDGDDWQAKFLFWCVILQVIQLLGDIVAQQVGLTYVNKEINNYVDLPDPASGVEDDWRRLYI